MMRKIIYTQSDGVVAVVTPCINTFPQPEEITEEEAEKRAWDRLPPDAINPQFVDASVIPADRTFRNAWQQSGVMIQCDMVKARKIHRDRLREMRAPKFAPLDAAWFKAAETGDAATQAVVAAKKQALRDVTSDPAIDAAATPEELKAAIPLVLLGPQ